MGGETNLLAILDDRGVILGLLFTAVLVTVLGVSWLIRPPSAVERRLAAGGGALEAQGGPHDVVIRPRQQSRLASLLDRWIEPGHDKLGRQLRERLARAGFRSPEAVRNWYLCRIALALGLPAAVLGVLPLVKHDLDYSTTLLAIIASCGAGFLLPSMWLDRRVRSRTQAIRLAFPDALDMMLVCVEAGLGIDSALHRTTTEIGRAHPVIAEEMALMTAELRAGKQRAEVLKDFAKRTSVEEVRSFVTVLVHAEQFGTSIADALRVYAAEMRTKRLLRAEEEANKLPVKLSVVVAGCTFPALFLLLLTPMMISILRAFDGMGQ
jgi:tight adherence protein C